MKILMLFLVLLLVIGQSCEVQDNVTVDNEERIDTENPDDELYDNLDSALKELEELEDVQS